MFSNKELKLIIVGIFILLLFLGTVSAEINVNLNSPADSMIFNSTNNITFNCSASVDKYLESVNLYHDINGNFVLNQTKDLGQMDPVSSTSLLFHFNNDSSAGENDTIAYDWSGNGNNGTVYGATFNSTGGKFFGAFELNGSDNYIEMEDSNSLDLVSEGTIEFWIKYNVLNDWTAVITKDESCGNSFPYSIYLKSSGRVRFILDDWSVTLDSNTYLGSDTWYHVVTTWNESEARIYVNGSLDEKSTDPKSMYADTSKLRIGITKPSCGFGAGLGSLNGTVDELALYNIMLSPEEVSEHFNRGLTNQTEANWTINNVPDGTYRWNCLAYNNESQSNWSSANYTFSLDLYTPPLTNSIIFSPNTSDDVDPGVAINVTANVTDVSNVSSAVFQYKECLNCTWVNKTMNNISEDEWNTSFTTVNNERVYYYRIWSNDTLDHSGYSDTYNISVAWDYSWTMNSSNLTDLKTGLVNTVNDLGMLVINNTGDDTLIFTLTDDWYLEVYYNGSTTCQFSLDNKSSEYINITALFEDHDSETNLTINISAEPSAPEKTTSPKYRTVNVTLNSYTGGPYFNVDIISPPTSVYQSQAFNLTLKIKNIGNESSTNTSLNWTLPAGWNVVWGNVSEDIGTLSSGETVWKNITVNTNPSTATSGLKTVYANVTCNESVNQSAYTNILLICNDNDDVCGAGCNYLNDDDCPSPGGGTTTVSTAFAATEAKMSIEVPGRLDLNRGESGTFSVYVHNTVSGTVLKNIILQISGYPQIHMKISPSLIDGLNYNEKKSFNVEVNVPEYVTYGEYELTLKAQGTSANNPVQASAKTTLFVHSATENETKKTLEEAEESIQNMIDIDLNTKQLSSLLEQAKTTLDEWDYDKADELGNEIVRISEIAFRVNSMIKNTEASIDQAEPYGMNVPETRKMYSLAMAAFQRGDYERAEERAESALLTYSIETHGLVGILNFVYGYWWALIIVIIVLIVALWRAHRVIIIRSISGKLKKIDLEEKEMLGMIKDYQKRYWQDKSISAEDYQGSLSEHENRMIEVMKNRSDLTIRKIKLTADNLLHALEREMESVKRRMSDLQKKYFEGRDVSKTSYLMMMNGLNTEAVNIQKNLDMMKSGKGRPGKSGKSTLVLALVVVIIILLLAMLPYVNALGDKDRALEAIQNAEIEIQSMKELGFGTSYVNDTLNEAKLLYNQEKYLAAESLAEKVTEIKNLAIETDSLIDQVESMLYESHSLGIDISPAELLFNQSLEAFGIEDYIQAKDLLTQTINKLDELESEAALQKTIQKTWYTELSSFLRVNWVPSLIIIIIVVVAVSSVHFTRKSKKAKKRLSDMEDEKNSLEKILKELQVKYFRDSLISKSEYERLKTHYKKSLLEIERNMKLTRER